MKKEQVKQAQELVNIMDLESEIQNNVLCIMVPTKETDLPSVYDWTAFACFSIGDVKNALRHAESIRVD